MSTPLNLEHLWLPFTPNRAFQKAPRLLVRAEGLYFWNERGARLVDACSGLFTTPLGHARREVVLAIQKQAETLDYAPAFQYAHPGAFELASRLAEILPGSLSRIFFTSSGSDAVDTAMKLALAYHRANGEPQRQRFVSRELAYHGVNLGGTALSGLRRNRAGFGSGGALVSHMRHTLLEANRFHPGQPPRGAELASDLERAVDLYGADTIAACFVEPVAGSVGVLPPPVGYLERLREIADRHGILLVFDEVITGFGRTGQAFAAQTFGVEPDLVTLAKALTNGAVPMGAVAVRDAVQARILAHAPDSAIELFHGYTYSAHPLACAAGLAALGVYREDDVFARGRALAPYFHERVAALRGPALVRDIRSIGLLAAVELEPAAGGVGLRGAELIRRLYEAGVVVRVSGDTLILAPALVATREQIDEMFDPVSRVLESI